MCKYYYGSNIMRIKTVYSKRVTYIYLICWWCDKCLLNYHVMFIHIIQTLGASHVIDIVTLKNVSIHLYTLCFWSLDLECDGEKLHAPVNCWSPSSFKWFLRSDGCMFEDLSCFTKTTSSPPTLNPTTMWVPYFSMNLSNVHTNNVK